MNKNSIVSVPYIAYEKEIDDKNKTIRSLRNIIILLVIAIVLIDWMFLSFINKHDFTSYAQDGNGINNMNSGVQGDITNESESKNNN